ncbi:assimilatory sulfite reductase (NADPH) flavoprotein subunit [Dokdonella sp.]|uniref:assimilatory sulfite reductase (NADPH) flavoprotein subunit n=1 Tax=Dokdonella sp. TaxID=2291710 RepID=UPI001B2EF710|nr:assimilatory sulfite reductase (NADPH) flavoprotein subunit [Dokdonella sp.]MBO9664661.1 assimilatory sulfite reductase (NADPH) flavoprotein subunit [Dokdonella sp.]
MDVWTSKRSRTVSALPALPLAPLTEDKTAEIRRALEGLEPAALWWLSGYTAALAAQADGAVRAPSAPAAREAAAQERLTVVYGSQTGNSKRLAEKLARDAESAGLAVRLLRADAYPQRELKNERQLAIVISTQGDGDPPDDARGFVEFLAGKRAPQLPDLKYSVLALGDSSYPQFCAIGRRLDARLAELGATRLAALAEADLDIDTVATPWLERTLGLAREALKASTPRAATVTPLRAVAQTHASEWTRERPFAAELLVNQRITARDGTRDVRHVELSLEGSGLAYEPGDALGVWPTNPPALVDAVLDVLHLDGETTVAQAGETRSLRDWLLGKRELTKLARPFVAAHAAQARAADLNRLLAPDRSSELGALLQSHQVVDLLRAYPAEWQAEEFVAALRPLTPRLYSIASSRKAVGDEVHLTVAKLEYEAFGHTHLGAASAFLAAREDGANVPVFLEANERFRLPRDGARDVIMIGPGTGVAPFRGFVQERAAVGARGRNWLFFGNPYFDRDFLYQLEWQAALKDGSLHRLDLAFSRDQAEKIYVQQRLRERGRELYDWLESGAHLYVCGDATRMAKDVHAALVDIAVEHGGKDREQAVEYVDALQQQGRYARDVY